jgi:hypothetical protein
VFKVKLKTCPFGGMGNASIKNEKKEKIEK